MAASIRSGLNSQILFFVLDFVRTVVYNKNMNNEEIQHIEGDTLMLTLDGSQDLKTGNTYTLCVGLEYPDGSIVSDKKTIKVVSGLVKIRI